MCQAVLFFFCWTALWNWVLGSNPILLLKAPGSRIRRSRLPGHDTPHIKYEKRVYKGGDKKASPHWSDYCSRYPSLQSNHMTELICFKSTNEWLWKHWLRFSDFVNIPNTVGGCSFPWIDVKCYVFSLSSLLAQYHTDSITTTCMMTLWLRQTCLQITLNNQLRKQICSFGPIR